MPEATLHKGDALVVMPTLDAASVDSVVTDPPYDLSTGKGRGFMGRKWDGTGVAFRPETWAAVRRVMKPGAYLLAFGGTRTSHRMACAIEDAGFAIRDTLMWIYGQGFPKAKSCLKPGWEPIVLAWNPAKRVPPLNVDGCRIGTTKRVPGTLSKVTGLSGFGERAGRRGQSLEDDGHNPKLGRWPANVILSHRPECREVGTKRVKTGTAHEPDGLRKMRVAGTPAVSLGRTVTHADPDGLETVIAWECVENCPVAELDRQSGKLKSGGAPPRRKGMGYHGANGQPNVSGTAPDSGGASRFFYCPKASRSDRGEGNAHCCVKPHNLMRWLCRLVTPEGGTTFDPFMGSGSTGKAAVAEGFGFLGIDNDADAGSFATAKRRIAEARAALPLLAGSV